ncbi:uncharacterized protein LOC133336329 [Musca vetustissima]|uniref:uncharacterized protein LOC133336329 n=1 Tax=Musca vetustissima TaxID=27455 RepID=UPI002AB7571A|nr:uncharacterized protein LOC133336329 [Musca vetustissima]
MKYFSCLIAFFALLAVVLACDPDSNNEPVCSKDNLNVPVRNFWDPTAYWQCESAGAAAKLVRCPDAHLFDSAKGECVLWNEWSWTNPCPENQEA